MVQDTRPAHLLHLGRVYHLLAEMHVLRVVPITALDATAHLVLDNFLLLLNLFLQLSFLLLALHAIRESIDTALRILGTLICISKFHTKILHALLSGSDLRNRPPTIPIRELRPSIKTAGTGGAMAV